MGITGLLRVLKPTISSSCNIQSFSSQTIAIDASSWLQKGAYSCGERLVEYVEKHGIADQVSNDIVTKYMMKKCNELLVHAKIKKIILVFDGIRIPLKKDTNVLRDAMREKNIIEARMLKSQGKINESKDKYLRCTKFTKDMVLYVANKINEKWKKNGGLVEVIMSPFEADAQLAYLCKIKKADAVITEDSDVLVYSASSNTNFPIITKLDKNHNGYCEVYSMDWIDNPKLIQGNGGGIIPILKFMSQQENKCKGKGRRMFIQACVLAGNDYTPGINGVGIVGAFRHMHEQMLRPPDDRFKFILAKMSGKMTINEQKEHEIKFAMIEATFYYHYIINAMQEIVSLTDERSSRHVLKLERFQNDYPSLVILMNAFLLLYLRLHLCQNHQRLRIIIH